MSAKQAAESQQAQAALAEMQQRGSLKEDEASRLLAALNTYEVALEQQEINRIQNVAQAYNKGVETAAKESMRSPHPLWCCQFPRECEMH